MTDDTNAAVSYILDGEAHEAEKGELIISAAERVGTYIPRFCYHPRMKPVGMCRMCLVEVSGPRGATLQPACFLPVIEGMEVTTQSDKVKKAQDGVLELLLVNHPLDCPVCDKGGECPLQDQTLAYGPGESRFLEEKRHFEKPIAISDLVLLDRERCIQCARCTRFAEEIAGEAQIDFAGRGELIEVATFPDEPFSSYFSGNTVQICPVGALTATPYRFSARPWDLDQVESTCTTCSVGCRTAVQSSANRLTRLLGIDSDPVNHGWLCDKGRFAFEAVNGPTHEPDGNKSAPSDGVTDQVPSVLDKGRILEPMIRKSGEMVAASWNEALDAAAQGIRAAQSAGGPGAVAVLGGARCTNEGAYAWARLAKGVIGTDTVDCQPGDGLPAELILLLPRATIDEACFARTVVMLSGDIRDELPILFLRLRQAALDGTTSLIELSNGMTSLSRYAKTTLALRPGDGPLVARALTGDDTSVATLGAHPEGPAWGKTDLVVARDLVGDGTGVVIVVGRPSMAEHGSVIAEAAAVLAQAWPAARFLPALRRGNVMGALDMGLAPGVLPGRVSHRDGARWFGAPSAWGSVPTAVGLDGIEAVCSLAGVGRATGTDRVRALLAIGIDVVGDFPDADVATRALHDADFIVAVAGHHSATTDRADVVLPVAIDHERPGTVTNIEGRVSRLGQKLVAPGQAWADWMIASELASALGSDLGFTNVADIAVEIERLATAYEGVTTTLLESAAGRDGVCVPFDQSKPGLAPGSPRRPLDPMAVPGIDSVERQGAPPRVGQADAEAADRITTRYLAHDGDESGTEDIESFSAKGKTTTASPGNRPSMLSGPAAIEPVHIPPPDNYSLRLVAGRRLYDHGSAIANSPSLVALVQESVARANPYDFDRLGVTTGDRVQVRSPKATLILSAMADPGVPRGVVAIDFGLSSPDGTVADLIDIANPVTDVRVESV